MANENHNHKRNYVHLGGFAVWIAATALMMLHNGEATYARAVADKMAPLRAFVEAGLTVLTIEVTGLYFLYAATKADITPAQRRVAGWSVGLSVALGFAINLLGGLAGAEHVLNIVARVAQGVCLVLIARWHWVGNQVGEDLGATVARQQAHIQQLQADNADAMHQNGAVLQSNERLQAERDTLQAQLAQQQTQHEAELREMARIATVQREPKVTQPAKQLTSGITWEQGVAQLKSEGKPVGATALAEVVGKDKGSASRWLSKHPEVTQ